MTEVTTPPKVARNLTRSFFEIGHKRCNSNDRISNPKIHEWELRATLLGNHSVISHRRGHRHPEHQRRHRQSKTPGSTGAKGVGWTCRGAGGRRWGLAGQRVDAPSRRLTARTARGRVTTHRHTQRPGTTGVEGAGGSGGHGRASRSTTPSDSKACGDLAGGRARRRPEHQRRHTQRHTSGRAAHTQRRTSIRATSNQAPRQPRNANARQPERAAARSRN